MRMSEIKEETKEQMEEEKSQPEVNVEVKQMLTVESKYCTRIRHTISMKSPVPSSSPIIREDIPVPDARVFLLHNLLTPSECSHYIRETEEICYRDLRSEFEESYRSNERLLVLSETLADYLWKRMQPHLHRNDVIRVRPMCFGNGGSWLPHRLNECFKFGKYQKKQHFGSHIDGPWVPRADESSIYTVLIYLNDNFEGGETVFTPPSERAKLDQQIAATRESIHTSLQDVPLSSASTSNLSYCSDHSTGKVTVTPRQGTALIFTHDTLHAGLPVISGTKYVLRTEIMFTRRDSNEIPVSIRESYHSDPNYQQTVTFYMDSYAKSLKGDVPGFTNSYLAALKLQHEAQFSVSKDTKAIHELNLPLSLYVHLFTFLDLKDLISALQCSKSFKDIGKDGSLWKQLYRIRFPVQAQMESHLQHQQRLIAQSALSSSSPSLPSLNTDGPGALTNLVDSKADNNTAASKLAYGPIDPAIQDWYTIFKQRVLLQDKFEPVIFDFGSFSTKCSLTTPSDTPILELLNLVAIKPGMHDIHCRRGAQERYLVGMVVRQDPLNEDYYKCSKNIIVQGQPSDQISLVPELVASCLLKLSVWSYQHPMIIAEPPFGFEDAQRRALMKNLMSIFDLPGLCFVNSALLTLISQGHDSGIVAHIGHDTAWVAGIYRRRQISFYNFTPNLVSPNQLFNQSFGKRDSKAEIRDVTLTPQKQVTPEELAEWTTNTYHEMLASLNDDHQTNFHQVVLCGGGTIENEFKARYQLAIKTANSARRTADISNLCETMLKDANIISDASVHAGYIPDLTVIVPAHPTHTEVEGGKIFGGLSFFQQHCLQQFEMAHLDDVDQKLKYNRWDPVNLYTSLWKTEEWLLTQFMYFPIKNHFHEEEAGTYIANTSCSDDEVERVIHEERTKDVEQLELEPHEPWPIHSGGRSLVWRRRRINAKPRAPKPHKQKAAQSQRSKSSSNQDGNEQESDGDKDESEEEDYGEKSSFERTRATLFPSGRDQPHDPTIPMKPHPKYPMRRARRSAFPILPKTLVKWYQHQTQVRNLSKSTHVVVTNPSTVALESKEDEVDAGIDYARSIFDDESLIDAPHSLKDISCESGPEDPGPQPPRWEVSELLRNIRPRLMSTIEERRPKRKPAIQQPLIDCPPEEELEDLSVEEEFVEHPPRLVQFQLDHFRGLQRARDVAKQFCEHLTPPPTSATIFGTFNCWVSLCSKIPDGWGKEMDITFSVVPDLAILSFVAYELNGRTVAGVHVRLFLTRENSAVVPLGFLVECREPRPSDPPTNEPHYPHVTPQAYVYLLTQPTTDQTNAVESERIFLLQNQGRGEMKEYLRAAHECLAFVATKNQPSQSPTSSVGVSVAPPPRSSLVGGENATRPSSLTSASQEEAKPHQLHQLPRNLSHLRRLVVCLILMRLRIHLISLNKLNED